MVKEVEKHTTRRKIVQGQTRDNDDWIYVAFFGGMQLSLQRLNVSFDLFVGLCFKSKMYVLLWLWDQLPYNVEPTLWYLFVGKPTTVSDHGQSDPWSKTGNSL